MQPVTGFDWRSEAAGKSLDPILPVVERELSIEIQQETRAWNQFKGRLHSEWERLFICLHQLYGWQYDFFYTLQQILHSLARYWLQRPAGLKALDEKREAEPFRFASEKMVGGVLYVDLFSDNLSKLEDHIPYFKKLGITYLHLMPLFAVPRGDNDGGYAVSDYRAVNPDLGSMEDLKKMAADLRGEGISLVLDFVFNHTSDEHLWVRQARSGNPDFLAYYLTFTDRELPDQFQKYLRDIFPTIRKGSFSWCEDLNRWVWTTFNSYQWDLNYANPEVFRAMAEEMLFLANQDTLEWRLFHEMVKLVDLRKKLPALQNGGMEIAATGNPHLFGYLRSFQNQTLLMINNFAEEPQSMDADHLRHCAVRGDAVNLLTNEILSYGRDLHLQDHQAVWLDISGT